MNVKIYAEGGGDSQLQDTQFRRGWSEFFTRAGLEGRMPKVIRGKGRGRTFEHFVTALETCKGDELPLLLLDSEDAVASGHTAWQHLKARDGWDRPQGAADDQAFLMVQFMETWFLADRDALRRYFGGGLREKHLPAWPQLEAVSKPQVLEALRGATAACERHYAKGRVSFELLGAIDPGKVEAACPHARALLGRLKGP